MGLWVPIAVWAELAIIAFILLTTYIDTRQRRHQRWINYRLLAERIRQIIFVAPLGPNIAPEAASFRIAAHQAHGDLKNSWISWIIRGVIREAGLMNASMDQEYLLAYKDFLDKDGIDDQLTFHKNTRKRSDDIAHFLHIIGNLLFAVTLLACATHLIFHDWEWLTVPAAAFPAFGAAMTGIAFQAEFKRIGRRSKAMVDALGEASESLKTKPINYETIAETAINATDIMIAEVLDWRVLFLERKPQLPA